MAIDGLSTIMNEKYFVDDSIPRDLCKYIQEGFNVWIIIREQEDTMRWSSSTVSDFLRSNVLLLENFNFSDLFVLSDRENSVVITNYSENKSLYDVCGPVYNVKDFFNIKFPSILFTDFLFCFGFTEEKFYTFCEESNLIGVAKDKTVRDKDEKNKTNGMAFWVDPIRVWGGQKEDFLIFANICIEKKLFIPKNKNVMLGVIYQGKDEKNAMDSDLPLLYV
jgi:hypothetical protein